MKGTTGRLAGLTLALLLAACAQGGSPQGQPARYSHDVISLEEMELVRHSDLYAVVQSLRPQWLHNRGVSTIHMRESVKVYVDNSFLGGPESLRQISAHTVTTIRFLDGVQASQRWGLDHGMGAIMVYTRRQ